MPFSDLPLSVLFLIFLWIFLLIGFIPVWKRARAKMRRLRKQAGRFDDPGSDHWQDRDLTRTSGEVSGGRLNDYENMMLRRLAQAGGRGLSRKKLRAELFMDQATFAATLESLGKRGLVGIGLTVWRGVRFQLSRRGHDYAVEQGFVPILHS